MNIELENAWQALGPQTEKAWDSIPAQRAVRQRQSHNVLSKLRQRLILNISIGILITVGYLVLFWWMADPWFQLGIGLVILFNSWAIRSAWREYALINPVLSPELSLLQTLEFHRTRIQRWMAVQTQVARFVYPVAAASGFVLGGSLGAGKPVAEIMTKLPLQIALVISMMVLGIAGHYLGKWLNEKAFGTLLREIDSHLADLKSAE